MRTKKMFF